MAVFNSTQYTKLDVNKYLGDARDRGGRAIPIPFTHTVTTETTADTTNLVVLPANCEVVSMDSIAAVSFGGTCTVAIGDSGSNARYQIAIVMTAEVKGRLAAAGMRFRPTADTVVFITYAAANPAAGAIIRGLFWVVPGA